MNCTRGSDSSGGNLNSLEAIVASYLGNEAKCQAKYLRYYQIQRSLPDAIRKAGMALLPDGSRFSHQAMVQDSALVEATELLVKTDFSRVASFEALHVLVQNTIGRIHGIGVLTIYDTAHRLGARLRIHPEFVYLHAGAKVGAKALGLDDSQRKLPMCALPGAFQVLTPEQAEDCLCIYKDVFRHLRTS